MFYPHLFLLFCPAANTGCELAIVNNPKADSLDLSQEENVRRKSHFAVERINHRAKIGQIPDLIGQFQRGVKFYPEISVHYQAQEPIL